MHAFNEPVKKEDENKIKVPIPVVAGKTKLIEPEVKAEEARMAEVHELKMKLKMAEERAETKMGELKASKEFSSSLQAEHDKERQSMLATIEELRTKLSTSTVEASHLKGQLLVMKELTTLTKENAASSMSILYDKLRKGPLPSES